MTISPAILRAFAPTGKLRAAINLGNPILAYRSTGGTPGGVSVDLARELARLLNVELELITFDAAGKSVEAAQRRSSRLRLLRHRPPYAARRSPSPHRTY